MAKKLINLYKEWMETGKIPGNGLCNSMPNDEYKYSLEDFAPYSSDKLGIINDGESRNYWGAGLSPHHKGVSRDFTPLRQTIVLLICAMNNEL